jgi:hypothetical protein
MAGNDESSFQRRRHFSIRWLRTVSSISGQCSLERRFAINPPATVGTLGHLEFENQEKIDIEEGRYQVGLTIRGEI